MVDRDRPSSDRPPQFPSRLIRALPYAALALAWAVLFAPQLFRGQVFVLGDCRSYRQFQEFSRERWLAQHERTFWNPYVFTGLPAVASLADPRPQYLPDGALDALEGAQASRAWPPLLFPLLVHLVGMFAAAALARALWDCGRVSMAWAGLAWGLLPNVLVPLAFGHESQFIDVCFVPVILWLVHRLFAAESWRAGGGAWLGLAGAAGLATLVPHPQFLAYSALAAGVFSFERALHFGRRARLAAALGAAVFAAAISMVVWRPAMLYGAESVRGGPGGGLRLAEVAAWSLAPRDFLSAFWPSAVGFAGHSYWGGLHLTDYPQYFGIVVLALAVFAGYGRSRPGASTARLFLAMGLLAALSTLGTRFGPVYTALRAAIPGLSMFRVAVAGMILAQLCAAMLSAKGLDRILRGGAGAPKRAIRALAVCAGVVMLLAAVMSTEPGSHAWKGSAFAARPQIGTADVEAAAPRAALDLGLRGVLLLALAGLLAASARPGAARIATPALLLVLALDLGSVSAPLLRSATGHPSALSHPPRLALSRAAEGDPFHRVCSLGQGFFTNDWLAWRVRSLGGEHGAIYRSWQEAQDSGIFSSFSCLRGYAVKYFSGDSAIFAGHPAFREVAVAGSEGPVWELEGALPRAHAAASVEVPGSDAGLRDALINRNFDPTAVVFAEAAAAAGRYPGSQACRIRWIEDAPDRQRFLTVSPAPAFLVVADAWFPGWTASIDDRPAPLYRVNRLVRGLPVPAGPHAVTLQYLPSGWHPALEISRGAMALWLVLALAWGVLGALRLPVCASFPQLL